MKRFVLAGVVCLLASCGGGGSSSDPGGGGPPTQPTGGASGRISFFGGAPGLVIDQEPNDGADAAQGLGEIPIGGRSTVIGEVDAVADPMDGYALACTHRARLTVELTLQDPASNELVLSLFEPVSMQVVRVLSATASPTTLHAYVKGPVHVVVRAQAGATRYELGISVDLPQDPVDEGEPNAPPGSAAWLGAFEPGDDLRIAGDADASGDAEDAFLLLASRDLSLNLVLEHPAFTDFAIDILDATADLMAPEPLRTFDTAATSPETGTVGLDAPTLALVVVRAVSGQGPWRLTLSAGAPVQTTNGLRLPRRVLAAASTEDRRLGLRAGERRYGATRDDILEGEVIVSADEAPDPRGVGRIEEGHGPWRIVRVDTPETVDAAERRRFTLSRSSLLGMRSRGTVEPNRWVHACVEPDDTYYGYQWHYRQIGLPAAWEITTGSSDVIVAVIDTGQTNHPDLAGRQIAGYDMISIPSVAGDGDGVDADPTDVGDGGSSGFNSWHGTHVAGTIGAATNNGKGVAGIAWGARIMHVRALGIGGGTVFDIANAVRYAARLSNNSGVLPANRADIVNMSLAGPGFSTAMRDACDAAKAAGVVLVAAAGNESSSAPSYPAAYSSVISVVAVDATKQLAPYSNFGPTVDIAAPGGNLNADVTGDGYADGVLSTLWDDSTFPMTPIYAFYQGTSMASPHVAGVAALLLSVAPTLTPDQVRIALEQSAEDLGAMGRDDTFGWGLLNAATLLAPYREQEPVGPPVLGVSPLVLNFGPVLTQLDVGFYNAGGGLLDVDPAVVSTEEGGSWLAIQTVGPPDDSIDVGGLHVSVSRAGLLPGTYLGAIDVSSSGGSQHITVAMTVEFSLPPHRTWTSTCWR